MRGLRGYAAALIALIVALMPVAGCSIKGALKDFDAWLGNRPQLTSHTAPEQSTGSITSAFDRRAEAEAAVREGDAAADLRSLSSDLATFLGGGTKIREVHLTLTTGEDRLTLTGRTDVDEPTIAAWAQIRRDSDPTRVEITRGWWGNGLTEDLRVKADLGYADPTDLLEDLAATSSALADLDPSGEATWSASGQFVLTGLTNRAITATTARALTPILDHPGARVAFSDDSARAVEVSVPDADPDTVLTLYANLTAGGPEAWPSGVAVGRFNGDLNLEGTRPLHPEEEEQIRALLALDPTRVHWSEDGGYAVVGPIPVLQDTVALLPPDARLQILDGSDRTLDLSGTSAEVGRLLPLALAAIEAAGLQQLTVSDSEVTAVVPHRPEADAKPPRADAVIAVVRALAWDGERRLAVSGRMDVGDVRLSWTGTTTSRARDVNTYDTNAVSQDEDTMRKSGEKFIERWDAGATS